MKHMPNIDILWPVKIIPYPIHCLVAQILVFYGVAARLFLRPDGVQISAKDSLVIQNWNEIRPLLMKHLSGHRGRETWHLCHLSNESANANKQVWLELVQTPQYRQGLKERYKIEHKFGEAKQGHGLGRCRYLGETRFAVQAFFTAIMLNLKRMVKLLTGVGFKIQAVSA